MGLPQGIEWILIVVLALIIFGPKNLPKIGRAIGQSIRGFKEEVKGISDDVEDAADPQKESTITNSDEFKK